MHLLAGWTLGLFLLAGQASGDAPLTEDGLRAWLVSGGVIEANHKSIHEQFAVQRTKLPPWWPTSVADQEEDAMQQIDMAPVALPFYSPCISDTEIRVLVKMKVTQLGKSAVEAHRDGDAPVDATQKTLTKQDTKVTAKAFTREEITFAAKRFTPARVAAFKQCSDGAFAKTSAAIGTLQQAAVDAVIEKNRPELVAAKTAWVEKHPESPQS
jgi:hypothetical protein